MKKLTKIVLFLFFAFSPILIVKANDEYKIENYNIDIIIDDEGIYTVDETIDALFYNANVLITKELPNNSDISKIDSSYSTEISDVTLIKIYSKGNSTKSYNYQYTYKREIKYNDIYEIEIANNFNNDINNITFSIEMPKSFNEHNLDISYNDEAIKDLTYEIKDNLIQGSYTKVLEGDKLTITVDYGKLYINNTTLITIIISIVLTIISYIIWYIYGKDLQIKVNKTSKIPSGFTPLEVALVYKGEADEEASFYLLLELATKGYITIEETSRNYFTITRKKDYDGKNYIESQFLKALFKKDQTISLTDYVNIICEKRTTTNYKELDKQIPNNILYNRFRRASNNVLSLINTNEERTKYFEKTSDKLSYFLIFMLAIIIVLISSLPFIEINMLFLLPLSVIFSIVTLFLLTNFVNSTDIKSNHIKITTLVILAVIVLLIMLIPSFRRNRVYLLAFTISCICASFILFLYKYMPKRTIYGANKYAKLEGLKLFLNTLNNDDLDRILELDNNYLYSILPYSYILNSQEIILSKINEYKIPAPSWYKLNTPFNASKLNSSIARLRNKLKNKDV